MFRLPLSWILDALSPFAPAGRAMPKSPLQVGEVRHEALCKSNGLLIVSRRKVQVEESAAAADLDKVVHSRSLPRWLSLTPGTGVRCDGERLLVPALDWSQCPAVESVPGKVSGTWVLRGTRMPVSTIFENLEAGANIDDILSWFEGLDREQVKAVIEFAARSLDVTPSSVDR